MQLGLTWPLQRLLHQAVPYGEPASRLICWDLHCITLHGRSSLLLVHCASRYTCVRFDMTAAGRPELTRTHGRREVAFLNRAWEDVLAADLLTDPTCQRQPALNSAVNSLPCRCAGVDGTDSALAFLRRCFAELS